MAVEHQVGPGAVDRLGEKVAAQEWVDLQPLAYEGLLYRGVVQESHLQVRIQPAQSILQPVRHLLGVPDKGLHLGLAEVAATCSGETAAETL